MISPQEEGPPGKKTRIARQGKVLVLGPQRIEFVELLQSRQFAGRLKMVDDRERDQHRPTPRRHFVNVKWQPLREQNHLYWNGGQVVPRKLPKQRKIELAEGIHARNSTETQNVGTSFPHAGQIGGKTRQL